MAANESLRRQSETRESAIFTQTIRERSGEREEIHKKTFQKWINSKLAMAVPPLEVKDLIEEVRDGHVFLSLLEVLLGTTLKREKGRMRLHKLTNVTTALKVLEKNKVKLVGISNYDIVDGKSTTILGLIWSIILRFQVQGVMTGDDSGDSSVKDFQVEKKLLSWCKTSLEGYEDSVKLKDFTTSWRDGLAFNAIIHTHKPELFRFESLLKNDNKTNLDHAFNVANEEFSVPKLLDPADIDVDKPDKKLVMMYLTSLFHGLREYSPQGGKKRRKLDDLAGLEAYRASLRDLNAYITQEETLVSNKLESTGRFGNPLEDYNKSKSLMDDIKNHRQDVGNVEDMGQALIMNDKIDEIHRTEIKSQLLLLHDRWEKLEKLSQRLHKRCRGALVSPREQQIDIYNSWIQQMRSEISKRGRSQSQTEIRREIDEHEGSMVRIDYKKKEVDRVISEVNELCLEPYVDEEDREILRAKQKDLNINWDKMTTEAHQKSKELKDKLSASSSAEENRETELLVQVSQDNVQSTPSEFSTFEIQPNIQHTVESQPNVHYLIDFEDDHVDGADQIDSHDREAERDAKLDTLRDKMNAVQLVLERCSGKLENLKSSGAPNDLPGVKEQQNMVKDCDSELKEGEPLLQDVILYGRELSRDDLFDDNEKEEITRNMAQLQEHYDELRNFIDDEQEGLSELRNELEKRNKIRDWERKRDELNEKLSRCEDKLRLQIQDQLREELAPSEEILAAAKNLSKEISDLDPEVARVTDDGIKLVKSENIGGDLEEKLVQDINDIEERYEKLKKSSSADVKRLEDAISQRESEKREKLEKWQEVTERISVINVDTRTKLRNIKEKNPHTTPEIQEQLEAIQKCTNDVMSVFPEIQSGYDYGNDLLADNQLSDEDRDKIEKEMNNIGEDFKALQQDINAEQDRLNNLLSEKVAEDARAQDKLKKWQDGKDKLNSKYKKTRGKFNKVKGQGIPKDPKKVQEQLELTRECSSEIADSVPEIQQAFKCAEDLISDKSVDPRDRESIKKERNEIGEGFKSLKLELNDYEKELEDLGLQQDKEKSEKITTWQSWIIRIRKLQDKCQAKTNELKEANEPQNKKEVEEQMVLVKECKEDLEAAKPVIHEGIDYGKLLIDDEILDDEVKASIKKDVNDMEYNLEKMEKDNADEQGRLEILAIQFDTDKKDKLEKWETWKVKLRSILALKRNHLDEVKADDPTNRNVEELLAKAKDCEDSLTNTEPEIKFALDYGEQLVDDDLTDPNEKQKIHDDVVEMERTLKDLKEDTAKEKLRLQQIYFQQNEEKEKKLKQWEIWVIRINKLQGECREKVKDLKSKGDPRDKKDLEEQIVLAKEFEEELQSAKPVINEGTAYGSLLLNDDIVDEDNKAKVKQDLDHIEEDLKEFEKANGDEQKRLEDILYQKGEEQKVTEWKNRTTRIHILIKDCGDKMAELQAKGNPKDRGDAEEQITLSKECSHKLQASKLEINAGLAFGKELLEDDYISDVNKANIKQDLNELGGDMERLERANDEHERRIRERLVALQKEEAVIKDWRDRCASLTSYMDAADEKIQNGKNAETNEDIESSYILLKDLSADLVQTEPEMIKTLDFGRELASNKNLSSDSRQKVTDDVSDVEKRWKTLMKESQDEYARLGVELGASQARQRNLETWHERCDDLHGWVTDRYTRLRSRPTSPEASFGGIKRQQSVIEDLVKDLTSKQGEVNEVIDEGNQVIDDHTYAEKERKLVHEKMTALHDDWNKLATLTSGKQQSVQVLLLEKEQQHLDKTQNWRRRIDPLVFWVSSAEDKLNTQFAIAPDLDTVKKQKAELEDFNNEMLSHQREVSETLEYGDKLLKDPELPEDDRTAIQKEVLDLSHRWENLEELVNWKSERIDDTISKLKMQQEDKLQKWHEGLDEVSVWVVKTRVKVEAQQRLATDVDAALEQIDDFQEIIKDAPGYQEKVTHLNEFSGNLVTDPCLGEEERRGVREETVICNENWNDLVNLANAKQARMEENLNKLERQEQDALERWRIRSERAGLALDKLEGQISVIDDPIGNDIETVRRQEDAFEIFSNEMELNTTQMLDTLALGEKVKKDPKLTQKRKDEVVEHLNSLTAHWDRIKDFVALRKERLDEASKRMQRDRRKKLDEWEEKVNHFDSFLRKAERETERLEPIADDLETVQRQYDDFQKTNQLIGQQKKVDDFETFTVELLADPVIDERSKQSMEHDKDDRLERWERVVEKINDRQHGLEEQLTNLEKTEGELSRWNDQFDIIQEEVAKVESVCEQEIAPDFDALEKQKTEVQRLKKTVNVLDPQVDDFLKNSDRLIDQSDVPEKDLETVEHEAEVFKKRWNKVKFDLDARQQRIEDKHLSLQQRQKDLLGQWKNSCNSTLKWLSDSSARVQAQDVTPPDLDHARAQRQEIEDILREIKRHDNQMDKLDQLGDKITNDPSMRDLERNLVNNEKATIIERYKGLLASTEAAKNRLDDQIKQMEKEQGEKMKLWPEKTDPLDKWLIKNETTVQSYEPIGYDISYVKTQEKDAQAMITELLQEQPKFAEMTDFGNKLTTEPCVGLEERVKIQKDMQSLHERWDGLYESATSRHDRIQDRLKILEDEQKRLADERKMLEEEEVQRQIDMERRRKEEEERRKKEAEERRRREEEARKRKEEEERKRREEEERIRKEEEDKRKRKEEEEKRRREEEARQRREEEERERREEEQKRKLEQEERKRKEEEDRKKREEERKQREEDERKKREEENRKRKEEQERRRKEQEERRKKEEEERKKREEERRKKREEEEKKKKEREEKKRLEEEEKKRKEEEKQKNKGFGFSLGPLPHLPKMEEVASVPEAEEDNINRKKNKGFGFSLGPLPHIPKVEEETSLLATPVDEVVVSVDEDIVQAAAEPDAFVFDGRLQDWKNDVNDISVWLKDQDEKLPDETNDDTIASLKDKESHFVSLEKEIPDYERKFDNLEKDYEALIRDKHISEKQHEDVSEDMDKLRGQWRSFNTDRDVKKNRIKRKLWDKEQQKAGELTGCRVNLQAVKDWIGLRDKEIENMDPIGNDPKTLQRQKEDMKLLTKRLHDYEPRFTEATDTAYRLSKDPYFSNEQSKALRQDAEDCEKQWDDVLEKATDRMDWIVKKIPKLQKDQKEIVDEWNDRSARFEKSLKKAEDKLKEQEAIGKEIGFERRLPEIRSPELTKKRGENNNEWKPTVDECNANLRTVRERLQDIQRAKKNRKWSILEALKDAVHSITARFRGNSRVGAEHGVNLDKVVDLLEDHEDIMTDASTRQKDADEVFTLGRSAIDSGLLENEQANEVHDRMTDLNHRWNGLNIDVIEREKRLEKLAEDIESEYKRFDSWREKCDNMNQWLSESEKLIKNEEKIGSDIGVLQEQIKDNQLFIKEMKAYEPKVDAMVEESQELVESSRLDKTDIDGVDKTKNALNSRWKAVNDHLNERQRKLDSALLDILKKDSDGRLGRWREQSIALGLLVTEAKRKVDDDVDDTDFKDIQESAVQLQEVENSLNEDLSRELLEVTNDGHHVIEKEETQPDDKHEIGKKLDELNRQVSDLEKGTREKRDKIKEASLKYFGRSLADCEEAVERLEEESVNNFTDIGSDIEEVGKQLEELQEFENDLDKEEAKFNDIKDQFVNCKETDLLRDEDRVRIQRRIGALDEKWAELNKNHDANHEKLNQALIVRHEELMEEVYDWLSDAEKQADSIVVNEDDIGSVMEEYGRHRELKEEISSFEPTFKNAIGISDRLLTERIVDPERAESYETEINTLENRWKNLQLKTMDNGAKLSGVLGRYVTIRLDEAEVKLTHAETSISRDDADYLDIDGAKEALQAFRVKRTGIHDSQKEVDRILDESRAVVREDFFKEHEQEHFQGRIDMIDKRNKGLEEKADKEERRLLDTYILLLKQHLQRTNIWLKMAESRIKQEGETGPGYDDVKKQLEDHQVFQEELRDHSMISTILGVDVSDPDITQGTQQQVKSLSDRWSKVWNWSEQRKAQLLKVLSNWQRFRDEQMILLNWLSNKEKTLKEMARTDLTDEAEVKDHLEKLRVIEKELDEQGIRLQSLHKAGEDLLKNVDVGDPAAKEIKTQLKDFDDCWNDIAKQVINRIQQLENSQSKLKEFHLEMDATNEWMDETERLLKTYKIGMDPEEASRLQEKTEIKCEERSKFASKVDRINRLGKDLAGEIDEPSHDAIQEELQPFNNRWSDVSNQLELYSDKGYPQPGNECCFLRIMRKKFGVIH